MQFTVAVSFQKSKFVSNPDQMIILYSIGIRAYYCAILIATLFSKKARLWIRGRKNIFNLIKMKVGPSDKLYWFHAASLGEFEQGRPVIEAVKKTDDSIKIILTFFSPSGYEVRKTYDKADYIFYLPIDTKKNALRFLKLINPAKVFFIKYEFWYHYLNQLQKKNIPSYLISANFRQDQIFFRWYGKWFRRILCKFTHIFVQNKLSEQLLEYAGLNDVTVSGDTRFDRVAEIARQSKKIAPVEEFRQNDMVIIGGSTWHKDEELLVRFINSTDHKIKYILAPHVISTANINRLEKSIEKPVVKYSSAGINDIRNYQVLIIDNIGMLSSLYKYADIAYIGGGFGAGIHNILEAAVFGLPVLFGPKHRKFQEALDLIKLGGAFEVCDCCLLKEHLEMLLDKKARDKAGSVSANYVADKQGATNLIISKI